jgi:NADPH-dependent glutamate synthase beta subunit-like oxidoreductase
VAINSLKRFVADYEMNSGKRVHNPRAPETGKSVAVVGGGAEGLTAAYLLNRLGHDSVVFESTAQLGGLLRSGIPQDRLPGNVLDWEIEGILDADVQVRKEVSLGKDFSIESLLKEKFSAVFIATGGWDTQLIERSKNENILNLLPGVHLLVDFVLDQRKGLNSPVADHVSILGGGRASLEAAGASLKNGAKDVTIILRQARNESPFSEGDVSEAEESGVKFRFQSVITRMTGKGNKLTHLEIVELSDNGTETGDRDLLETDILLTGAGRFPELIYIPAREGEEEPFDTIRWETLIPYAGPFAVQDLGIFRPGEEYGDYKAVVEAIGAGRRAASSIQRYLSGKPVEPPEGMIRKYTSVLNLGEVEPVSHAPRERMPEASHEDQINAPDLETATGYSEDQARRESERCLQCGLICYRRTGLN